MKYEITSVLFDHNEAMDIAERFIEKINEISFDQFEGKFHELEIWTDDEQLEMVLAIKFCTEWEDHIFMPDIADIVERSVDVRLRMYNQSGTEITWEIKPEMGFMTAKMIRVEKTAINIEDEIKKEFVV